METLYDPELKVLESNTRLAVQFAMRAVFEPSIIRKTLNPTADHCYMVVMVDQEDKRRRIQTAFRSSMQFYVPQTMLLSGDEHEAIMQTYKGGGTAELQFYGTERHGITVACAGFGRDICCMLSGIVIEALHGLMNTNKVRL